MPDPDPSPRAGSAVALHPSYDNKTWSWKWACSYAGWARTYAQRTQKVNYTCDLKFEGVRIGTRSGQFTGSYVTPTMYRNYPIVEVCVTAYAVYAGYSGSWDTSTSCF